MTGVIIIVVLAYTIGALAGGAAGYALARHPASTTTDPKPPVSRPPTRTGAGEEPALGCCHALDAAARGRLHASPSGRLVQVDTRDGPPRILDACPWCRAVLVRRLGGGEWTLTEAGQAHRSAVRIVEETMRARRLSGRMA